MEVYATLVLVALMATIYGILLLGNIWNDKVLGNKAQKSKKEERQIYRRTKIWINTCNLYAYGRSRYKKHIDYLELGFEKPELIRY